ncbi:ROK family protein [Actinoalloteichus sp. AHMU CJ021]|uniref:Glucokinase n=1 Tax=Actinoalloteichus caeruleus DSM 43889 TaxID=1120930 RepID=A0ABT1JH49_ACTCY|nr:ROK family protein [Actinoalloteichus caeruleus]AUS77868.1 ROK family protein [Actinoalloteichus sp. AHMU CJ021]MCP2331824.1 glucokinase [Actinoalloteichus caeruleus DSM 43889]
MGDTLLVADGDRHGGGEVALALDVGGTKIAGGLVTGDGAVLATDREDTPGARADADDVFQAVERLVRRLLALPDADRVEVVGIGSAAPVHLAEGAVSPVNIPAWRRFPLVDRVRSLLGGRRPVLLCGDGPAYAAAEHWLGAARGFDDAICLVVSTGVGGGLVSGGRLLPGPSGNAGHLGHVVVDVDGDPCACGSVGCVESIASGPSMVRWARDQGWSGPGTATAQDLAGAARSGEPIPVAAFDRAARALAAGIVSAAALTEVRVAVVGGGVAQAGPLLFAPLREHLAGYARLPFLRGLLVRAGEVSRDGGLLGAARVAFAARGDADPRRRSGSGEIRSREPRRGG